MALVLLVALAAFAIGAFVIHRMRKDLAEEAESLSQSPLAAEGLPIHAYHAVIQELKQQKHELTAKQLEERRKTKASDTLSATVLANLSCGVLFFNTAGLVRQVNPAARQLLGFAAPVGMGVADLLRTASLRLEGDAPRPDARTVEAALVPALSGKAVVRGLLLDYRTPDGEPRVLELTVSPVMAEDAGMIGTAFVLTDRTELRASGRTNGCGKKFRPRWRSGSGIPWLRWRDSHSNWRTTGIRNWRANWPTISQMKPRSWTGRSAVS